MGCIVFGCPHLCVGPPLQYGKICLSDSGKAQHPRRPRGAKDRCRNVGVQVELIVLTAVRLHQERSDINYHEVIVLLLCQ